MTESGTSGEKVWREFSGEVASFTDSLFQEHLLAGRNRYKSPKVIRDSVHGYFVLHPWEAEVVDSPLLQRLRYIHQTALAFQVYPSAHHTRLEHSLGTAKLVSDVAQSMRTKSECAALFEPSVEYELRLAALLHDVGHCLFSHLSEQIIEDRFRSTIEGLQQLPKFEGRALGEILSHALLISPAVQGFLSRVIDEYPEIRSLDPERIANYCLGYPHHPDPEAYKSDLITGPLDVDKLDYLQRDTYFTGIRTEIDPQHIIRSMTVIGSSTGDRQIAAEMSYVSGVEHMHFAKALLFPSVYHHQKVRALEATVKGIFDLIQRERASVDVRSRFITVADFLSTSEHDFYALARSEGTVGKTIQKLLHRKVLRRALYISNTSITPTTDSKFAFGTLSDLPENDLPRVGELRSLIYERIPSRLQTDPTRLWLDLPPYPKNKDIMRCKVVQANGEAIPLTSLIPIDGWLQGYTNIRWSAHVFYEPESEYQQAAAKASDEVLNAETGIEFNSLAFQEAKSDGN